MKPSPCLRLAWMLALALGGTTPLSADTSATDPVAAAQEVIDLLAREDYPAVVARFDAAMKRALPEDRLRMVWRSLRDQIGPFRKRAEASSEALGSGQLVVVPCEFRDADLDAKVTLNSKGEIAGLRFVPRK
jgi:hypothetical protein